MNTFIRGLLCMLLLSQSSSVLMAASQKETAANQGQGSRTNPYVMLPRSDGFLPYRIIPTPGGMLIEKDVMVTMRDGVRLASNVYRPDKPGKFPVILAMTPYGKDQTPPMFNADGSPVPSSYSPYIDRVYAHGADVGHMKVSVLTPWEGPDAAFWVPNDYVVIIVDRRGGFKSQGKIPSPAQQGDDIFQMIEWAASRNGVTAT